MANQKTLEKKQKIVQEIVEKIENSNSTIFFEYLGLNNEEMAHIRKELKENNSNMKIYKNTLTKRALDKLKLEIDDCSIGANAIAFSEDVVSPIKILSEYSKKNELLQIKGGIIEGKVSTLETISKLSTIPSRETLLTMVAGGMIGVVKKLSIALKMYAETLENKEEK